MINPFSVILLLLTGFTFVNFRHSAKQLFFYIIILTACIELFIEVGYFIKLDKTELTYRRFFELILLFASVLSIINRPFINYKVFRYVIGLFISLTLSLTFLFIFPSNAPVANIDTSWDEILLQQKQIAHPALSSFVAQQNFQLLIFVIALVAIYANFKKEDYYRLVLFFSHAIKFFLLLGFFEFLLKYIFHFEGYGAIVEFFFGLSDSTIYEARLRGFGIELTGFTKEASHYSFVLFICTTILFSTYAFTRDRRLYKWIFLSLTLLFFCMSFSTLLFISCFLFIYILYQLLSEKNKKYYFIFNLAMLFGFLGIIFFLFASNHIYISSSDDNFFLRRLASLREEMSVIFDNSWQVEKNAIEWSNRVRLLSIFMTLKAFVGRPLFGYGFGTITCHGATAMMLSGTGIAGLYCWTKLNFYVNRILARANYKNRFFRYSILIYLFLNLFNSFALRPFHELYSFLFAISLSLLFESKNTNENNTDHSML